MARANRIIQVKQIMFSLPRGTEGFVDETVRMSFSFNDILVAISILNNSLKVFQKGVEVQDKEDIHRFLGQCIDTMMTRRSEFESALKISLREKASRSKNWKNQ